MMIEALNVIQEYNLNLHDCTNVLAPYYSFRMKMKDMTNDAILETTKRLEKAGVKAGLVNIQKKIKQQGKVYEEKKLQSLGVWLSVANGGIPTLSSILQLPEDEQNQIYNYLCNSYIMLCERAKEQDVLFVHAQPSQDLNSIKKIHANYSGIKYSEMSRQDIYPMVWNRRDKNGEDAYIKCKKEGLLTICGHEPEHANIVQNWNNGYICIDAGSGHGGRVALYDVENDSLELIMEDGTLDNKTMNMRTWN